MKLVELTLTLEHGKTYEDYIYRDKIYCMYSNGFKYFAPCIPKTETNETT